MVEFNRKKTYRRFIYSPFFLLILCVIFLILLKALWGVYSKERLSAVFLEQQQTEYNKIISRQKELAQSVDYLKTDQGVETEIRSKFRVVKDGESVAVIVDNDATTTPPRATSTPPTFMHRFFGFLGF